MSQKLVMAALLFLVVPGCTVNGSTSNDQREAAPANTIALCENEELTDLSKEPDYSANYLHRWQTSDGCDVRLDLLMTRQGEEACGGEDVADVLMTWPLGSTATKPQDPHRIFVKDPTGVFNDDRTTKLYQDDAELPEAARDTGFRQDDVQLWMVPEDDAVIYLVGDDSTERWPLDESPAACG